MMQEQVGVVLEVSGNKAKVKTSRHSDCENCGACPGNQAMIVEAQNPVGAKPGQRVELEIKEVNMLKAAFIVYMLPLIAIFLGALGGTWIGQELDYPVLMFQIIGGSLAFILSVVYIKFFDRASRGNSQMQPVITRIIS